MDLSNTFRALRHRNYRLFFAGQIISLIGTWMQNVAISWLVYRLTHDEFILGLTTFCTNAPVLFLAPFGGVLADRRSRHRIVVIAQGLFLVQAVVLAALTLSGRVTVPAVLFLGLLLGIVNAFEIPARQSLLVQLTSKEDLLSAISLNSVTFNGARILGPGLIVLGGPLFAALFVRMRARGWRIDIPQQFAASLLLMASAFFILTLGIKLAGADGKSAFVWLFLSYVLQSIGELLISPVGYRNPEQIHRRIAVRVQQIRDHEDCLRTGPSSGESAHEAPAPVGLHSQPPPVFLNAPPLTILGHRCRL